MALAIIAVIALVAFVVLPRYWVKSVIERHSADRLDIPGTGGELARHLLDGMKLGHVKVEEAKSTGDHYDPVAKAVRLAPEHFNGRSLSAVVIAAHEVGHAMQDATGYRPLQVRTRLAKRARMHRDHRRRRDAGGTARHGGYAHAARCCCLKWRRGS